MRTNICFDLDGVMRDLMGALTNKYSIPTPSVWYWTHEAKDIFEWVKMDYNILLEAPSTPYLPIILKYFPKPEIWTCQPEDWKPYTIKWIEEKVSPLCKVRFLTTEEKRNLLDIREHTLLVEDSPLFTSYENILLIDAPYNKEVKAERISSVEKLEEICRLVTE